MNVILLLMIGLALGIVVGWLVVTARAKAEQARVQIGAEGRIKAAESNLGEVHGVGRKEIIVKHLWEQTVE